VGLKVRGLSVAVAICVLTCVMETVRCGTPLCVNQPSVCVFAVQAFHDAVIGIGAVAVQSVCSLRKSRMQLGNIVAMVFFFMEISQ